LRIFGDEFLFFFSGRSRHDLAAVSGTEAAGVFGPLHPDVCSLPPHLFLSVDNGRGPIVAAFLGREKVFKGDSENLRADNRGSVILRFKIRRAALGQVAKGAEVVRS